MIAFEKSVGAVVFRRRGDTIMNKKKNPSARREDGLMADCCPI